MCDGLDPPGMSESTGPIIGTAGGKLPLGRWGHGGVEFRLGGFRSNSRGGLGLSLDLPMSGAGSGSLSTGAGGGASGGWERGVAGGLSGVGIGSSESLPPKLSPLGSFVSLRNVYNNV